MFSFFKKKVKDKKSLTALDKNYHNSVAYKKAMNTFPEKVLTYYRHTIVKQCLISSSYPETIVNKAKEELVIFLYLSQFHALLMPSRLVDELWHVFLQHTKEYREWCTQHFDIFIDHNPEPLDYGKSRFESYNEKSFNNRFSKDIIDTLWFYHTYYNYTSFDIFVFDYFYLTNADKNGYCYDLKEINKVITLISKQIKSKNRLREREETEFNLPDNDLLDNVVSLIKKNDINSTSIELESKDSFYSKPVSISTSAAYEEKDSYKSSDSGYHSNSSHSKSDDSSYSSSYSSSSHSSSSGSSCGSSCGGGGD